MGNRAEKQPSRVGLKGKLIVAGRLFLAGGAVATPAIAIACGGGSDNSPANTTINTPIHPEGTGMPSQTALATKITESPTPKPTDTLAPTVEPQITAKQGEAAVNNAFQVSGTKISEVFPTDFDIDSRNIDWCFERDIPANYSYLGAVFDSCEKVGVIMRDSVRNKHPELKPDLDIFIGYTQGEMDRLFENGKIDSKERTDSLKNMIKKNLTP